MTYVGLDGIPIELDKNMCIEFTQISLKGGLLTHCTLLCKLNVKDILKINNKVNNKDSITSHLERDPP